MPTNEELIEKTIVSSDLINGGQLNPEQQDRLVVLVRKYANLLSKIRFVRMGQPQVEIDKLHVGEPITESADENTDSSNYSKAKFNKIALLARKLRSQWNITTESLQGNIEQNNFEDTIFEAMVGRMATDLELLAIQGDDTITATDPLSRLLKRHDGWLKLAEGGHLVDAGGNTIEKGLFHLAHRAMPKQFRNDPGLRWVMSDTLIGDWMNYLSERETTVGDQNLAFSSVNPLNIPVLKVPLMPDDLSVFVPSGATPAQVEGIRQGPFVVVAGSNDAVKIDVDDEGSGTGIDITLTAGTFLASEIAQQLNDAMVTAWGAAYSAVVKDNSLGQLFFESPTAGAASEIDIQATANDAYTLLGLTAAVVTGANSGGAVLEGTEILLCNPENLVFGMLDGTRVFSEFNKNYDRIETVVFNQTAAKIENLDAVVKIKNVKLADLYPAP